VIHLYFLRVAAKNRARCQAFARSRHRCLTYNPTTNCVGADLRSTGAFRAGSRRFARRPSTAVLTVAVI
jgi:hypothetical protein